MAPRSPPKRVTRARAAAKQEDILSGPARKPAASKVQKSTAAATKKAKVSKDEKRIDAIEDQLQASGPTPPSEKIVARTATKSGTLAVAPRRRVKVTPLNPPPVEQTAPAEKSAPRTRKTVTRKRASAPEEEVQEKAKPANTKSSVTPAKTSSGSTKTTKATEKAEKEVGKAAEAPAARLRAKRATKEETVKTSKTIEAPGPAPTTRVTRVTRTRAASSAKAPSEPVAEIPKAKVTKKVTFEDPAGEDKENDPVTARRAPAKKETPATGMRAKPVRKPPTAAKSKITTTSRATRGARIEKSPPPRVLTPKKITQVSRAAIADLSDEDDELCSAKTPVRDLSLSPRRNPALAAALSPVQKLDLNQPLLPRSPVKPVESVMTSPARRPPPSPDKEVMRGSPLKESPKRGDLTSVLPAAAQNGSTQTVLPLTRSHLLQSPKRVQLDASVFSLSSMKPKQSPLKASLLGSPARRLASPKRTDQSATPQVSGDAIAPKSPTTPEDVTITSHFRTSVSPARCGRVYRMSDEELADEMDFDKSVLYVNSPLKVSKQPLFEPSKEEDHTTADADANANADVDAITEPISAGQIQSVSTVVEEMVHDSESILAADPAEIQVVLPKNDQHGVVDEMIQDSTAIGAVAPSEIEIALPVHDEEHDGGDNSSKEEARSTILDESTDADLHFRSNPSPSEESEDELAGDKTPARGPKAFQLSLTGNHTLTRLSGDLLPSTNHNIGFTPLAAQMSKWQAASPDKKPVNKIVGAPSPFSPIAALHVDGQVVTSRHSTPRAGTPRSALSSMKRQSLAPRVSLAPPAWSSAEKTSFFEDQMAGFEAQNTDEATSEFAVNFDLTAGIEQAGDGILTQQPCVEDESRVSEADDDTTLDSRPDGELTTDLIKFTNASNTAMVDFEQLAKEAQLMHEEEVNNEDDDQEYGDENTAPPLNEMEVTEMIAHTSAHEHFAEFPHHVEETENEAEDALKETVEQPSAVEEAGPVVEEGGAAPFSVSPSPQLSPPSELDISTPIQRDLSKPRYINTVVSKVPLRPEGQSSPIKIPRKRAHSLSNAGQQSPAKRSALTPVFTFEPVSGTPSPDRIVRSAAPSPAVTTPGQLSFAIDDFGDSTLDAISLPPEEEMMDFEVGNPDVAPSSVKSTKTVQSIAATPARTPLRQLGRGILSGTVIYVDVHTSEGADASGVYIDLLTQMGAKCVREWRWNPRASLNPEEASALGKVGITHVIYKDGGKRTLEKVRDAMGEVLCVGVRWVLDCEREQKWVDEAPYVVDHAILPRGGSRRRKSMEPSRLSNVNGTMSAQAGRRTSSAEFLTSAMREDLIKTPVTTLRSNTAADDDCSGDDTEISSTYNSPTTTMNVRHAAAGGFETPPELKNWDPATSATPMAPKTPAQPNFRREGEDQAALLKTAPPKQLGQKLFGGRAEGVRLGVGESRRTTMGWLPRVRSPLGK